MAENFNISEVLNSILRKDFKAFAIKVFNEVSSAVEYQDAWFITLMCSRIVDMMSGEYNRLLLNVPPRSMKSIICSVALPAFILGHNPEANVICVSYADELAKKLAGDCRNVMESAWYRELFPNTCISQSQRAIDHFRTTKGGGRFATSTGGTLTGIGAEWIIIDDPQKPQDAFSDTLREKVPEWYRGTLLSRLNNKKTGKIVVVMQRLHESDLSGYILETDDSYKHVKLPLIAEQDEVIRISPTKSPAIYIERHKGDLLHPERDSQSIVDKLRADLGEYAFAGQYQQNPAPLGGGMVKKDKLVWYVAPMNSGFSHIIQSWDTASKVGTDNAYSACITIGVGYDKKCYVLDSFRAKLDFPSLVRAAADMFARAPEMYKCRQVDVVIEDASSGTALIQELKNSRGINAIPIAAGQSKEVRLASITPQIENGDCLFPSYNPTWWPDFEKELLTFPASRFKDQCDALSQGIEYVKATVISATEPLFLTAQMPGVFQDTDAGRHDPRMFRPPPFNPINGNMQHGCPVRAKPGTRDFYRKTGRRS
jgi:predicted phage terminase large subunit-like protein